MIKKKMVLIETGDLECSRFEEEMVSDGMTHFTAQLTMTLDTIRDLTPDDTVIWHGLQWVINSWQLDHRFVYIGMTGVYT